VTGLAGANSDWSVMAHKPIVRKGSLNQLLNNSDEGREAYVENMIYADSISIIHGPPGHGKSYFIGHLSVMIASGQSWGPLTTVKPVEVLYCQTEGAPDDLLERVVGPATKWGSAADKWDYVFITPMDLADLEDAGVKELDLLLPQKKVLIIDSLYSSFKGSAKDDEVASNVHTTVQYLQAKHPGLAVIFVHHDHRDKRTLDGKIIDEGGDAFFGNQMFKAMADQLWHYRKQNGTPQFNQTKRRSRKHILPTFFVYQDEVTGLLSAESGTKASSFPVVKEVIKELGEATFQEVSGHYLLRGMNERTVRRSLDKMVDDRIISKPTHGVYKFIGGS